VTFELYVGGVRIWPPSAEGDTGVPALQEVS
jgi:hypothetical protein